MNIAGLQKMTLLDYPGKVACTVFLDGCNFRCPFCHNGDLAETAAPALMDDAELLAFLEKRRSMLDGVCISGGEPTLHKDLPDLIKKIKALGYCVKLDTNGYNPSVLKKLVEAGLIDYVAMDIKNSPERYAETAGLKKIELEKIEESIAFLIGAGIQYEFRTTIVEEFHDEEAIQHIGQWLGEIAQGRSVRALYLQSFVDRDTVLRPGLHSHKVEKMRCFQEILAPYVDFVGIRGID